VVTQELLDSIASALKQVISPNEITLNLVTRGWSAEDIQEAFKQLGYNTDSSNQSASANSSSSSDKSFFSRFISQDPKYYYPSISATPPTNPNRLYAIPLIGYMAKALFLFPVLLELYFLNLFFFIIVIINSFIVLFTGRYWRFAYDYNLGLMRLQTKANFFLFGITDKYPGFTFTINDSFNVNIPYPEDPNRLFAFPVLGYFVKGVVLLPFSLFGGLVSLGAFIGVVLSWFTVLFQGKYPKSTFELVVDQTRFQHASIAYVIGFSDTYPSFYVALRNKTAKLVFVVIGALVVLAYITLPFTLLNMLTHVSPDRQFSLARNTQRKADVRAILDAIEQYAVDNNGKLPPGIDATERIINSTGGTLTVDLCSSLVPRYIADIPIGPAYRKESPAYSVCTTLGPKYNSEYQVSVGPNNTVTVSAPYAELGETISEKRTIQKETQNNIEATPSPTIFPTQTPTISSPSAVYNPLSPTLMPTFP